MVDGVTIKVLITVHAFSLLFEDFPHSLDSQESGMWERTYLFHSVHTMGQSPGHYEYESIHRSLRGG